MLPYYFTNILCYYLAQIDTLPLRQKRALLLFYVAHLLVVLINTVVNFTKDKKSRNRYY